MTRFLNFILLVSSLLLSGRSFADAFGGFQSEHDALKGYFIADVGNATEVKPPHGKQWTTDIYELNGRCFTISSYRHQRFWSFNGKASLLLVNEQKAVRLAFFEKQISDMEVKIEPIRIVECPSDAAVVAPCETTEECAQRLEQLKQDMREFRKQLDKK